MFPLLQPGDEVLIDPRAFEKRPPQVGDVVMAQHPTQPGLKIVKRVTAVLPDDHYQISGDNPSASTDSRTFGPVSRQQILGLVTSRFG
ncbi:MAG: nickel-type superoxide dismutase maturation protease [Anaerolineales bacterium]|nr:nickel-type superoxide dismutase maturation protease [Anaerolineales bacterium]